MNLFDIFESTETYVLYFDGKPVATYDSVYDAEFQARLVKKNIPNLQFEIKKEICSYQPVQLKENLRDWFKEKWVRFGPDGKIRGACARGDDSEGKPKCLPQAKAHSLGKKGRASAAARKRREDPDPERRGPAKNVATKKKSNEGMTEGDESQFVAARYIDEFADGDHWYVKGTPEVIQRFVQLANSLEDESVKGTEYEPGKGMMGKIHAELGNDSIPQWQIVKVQNLEAIKPIGNRVLQLLMQPDLSYGAQEFMSEFLWALEEKGLALVTTEPVQGVAEGLDSIPTTLYHATYRPLLKSIKKYGLGGDRAQAKWEDSKPGVVYLAVDPNVAESYAETSDVVPEEWLDEIVILKISTVGLDKNKFDIDRNVQDNTGDTIEYTGIIPISNISLIKQGVAEGFTDDLDNIYAMHPQPEKSEQVVFLITGMTEDEFSNLWTDLPDPYQQEFGYDLPLWDADDLSSYPNLAVKRITFDQYVQLVGNYIKSEDLAGSTMSRMKKGMTEGSDDDIWGPRGNFAGDKHVDIGGVTMKIIQVGDTVKYLGQQAKVVEMSKDRKYSRISIGSGFGGSVKDVLTADLKQLGQGVAEAELDEACWKGYHKEGMKTMFGKQYPNCVKNTNEEQTVKEDTNIPFNTCPGCGGDIVHESELQEKQDACYHKVKSRYKVWPSAYASGALVQCRKKGAKNWGNKSEGVMEAPVEWHNTETGARDAAQTDHTMDEALEYLKTNYPVVKMYNVRRAAMGLTALDQPKYVDTGDEADINKNIIRKSAAHMSGVDSAVDYLQLRKNTMMSGSQQVTLTIGYSWSVYENPNSGIAILYYQDRGMAWDEIYLAGKTPKIQAQARQVFRDAGVLPIPMKKPKQQGVAEGKRADRYHIVGKDGKPTNLASYADKASAIKDRDEKYPGAVVQQVGPRGKVKGVAEGSLEEKWSQKYKSSINCSNPKGFSQKAHCAGKNKNESKEYYNVVGTDGSTLRNYFNMSRDQFGWFLKEGATPKQKIEVLRAFGSPKLKEYDLAAHTGGTQIKGDDNVISPVGSKAIITRT